MTCPCGKPAELEECCGRFLSGAASAATAEELMRSRYTAYTQQAIDYVVDTHVAEGRDEVDRDAARKWAESSEWLGLEVVETQAGGPSDDTGNVEFIARYRVANKEFAHHELARFRKEDGRWYYVDGVMAKPRTVVREQPKVGRNDPCPCGSGNKYKKCCGKAS